MKLLETFRNERGAVDLGSIMTGVIVVGITGGIVATTFLGVIPTIQNHTAKSSLVTVGMAQTTYKQGVGNYGTLTELVQEQLLEKRFEGVGGKNISADGKMCAITAASGTTFQASTLSSSGKYYNISNTTTKPIEVAKAATCFK